MRPLGAPATGIHGGRVRCWVLRQATAALALLQQQHGVLPLHALAASIYGDVIGGRVRPDTRELHLPAQLDHLPPLQLSGAGTEHGVVETSAGRKVALPHLIQEMHGPFPLKSRRAGADHFIVRITVRLQASVLQFLEECQCPLPSPTTPTSIDGSIVHRHRGLDAMCMHPPKQMHRWAPLIGGRARMHHRLILLRTWHKTSPPHALQQRKCALPLGAKLAGSDRLRDGCLLAPLWAAQGAGS
mmetsp:Transcript_20198/g.63750  ORF Transcript_20198/g.63750 Transcript_20198/m.63750 type:complete len:243 (-) Transcript_20198:342-1070(-)